MVSDSAALGHALVDLLARTSNWFVVARVPEL
jgi:hypothetical protein